MLGMFAERSLPRTKPVTNCARNGTSEKQKGEPSGSPILLMSYAAAMARPLPTVRTAKAGCQTVSRIDARWSHTSPSAQGSYKPLILSCGGQRKSKIDRHDYNRVVVESW